MAIGGRKRAAALGLSLILAAPVFSLEPRNEEWSVMQIETFLRRAPVIQINKIMEAGRSLPWIVTLKSGRTQARAMFKYGHRPSPRPVRHSYRYELAAYALDQLLGLDLVPPVVEREVEGTPGALQWYLEKCQSERDRERTLTEPPDLDRFLRSLALVQVFEALAGDECGDKDDTLIHTSDWRVCRVDFSSAFAPVATLNPACSFTQCSSRLFRKLESLTGEELAGRLSDVLSAEEIEALFSRARLIVDRFRALILEKGEGAVLF